MIQDAGDSKSSGHAPGFQNTLELKVRLNTLHKYKAMGYLSPLLGLEEPSDFLRRFHTVQSLLQWDHRLFSEAHNRFAGGVASAAAMRRSLDFKALEAMSRRMQTSGGGEDAIKDGGAVRRKPIIIPPPVFSAHRGRLPLPLAVREGSFSIGKWSRSTESILHSGGVFVKAPEGEPIRSIFRGTVIFAEWLKEYGQVMIIDHGEHYCSLIAHAEQLLKQVNEAVEEGEVIATVGKTGALKAPGLYFEIRHHGSPVDPLEWLRADTTSKE